MSVDDAHAGWWLASDGAMYPPDRHPDYRITTYRATAGLPSDQPAGPPRLGPDAVFKPLPYGGTCITCGAQIPKRGNGWHDPSIKKVACADCPPPHPPATPSANPSGQFRPNPAGGTSALAIGNSRKDPNWTKGAAGEYLMSRTLHEKLPAGTFVFDDRAVPHSNANIDHVVVARTGVWIIDSKRWKGLIQVKSDGGILNSTQRLFIDGRDESVLTEKIYSQVIPVANVLGDPSIPISPALVFVDCNWGAGVTFRALQHRPYEIFGVLISWPEAAVARISEPGPLSQDEVLRIATKLDQALPPAS